MTLSRFSRLTPFLSLSVFLCALLFAACSSGTSTIVPPSPTSRPAVKRPVVSFGSAVDVTDKKAITIRIVQSTTNAGCWPACFQPANVKVKIGTVITWINEGPVVHTVTATTGVPQPAPSIFDSGAGHPIKPQGTFTWTVTLAAYAFQADHIVIYYCQYHPLMEAELTIVP